MSTYGNTETKYIARRLVALALVVVVLAIAAMFNRIKDEIDFILYPPPPEPIAAVRLEKSTGNCWDVLEIRHGTLEDQSMVVVIMETCDFPSKDFDRIYDTFQDMAALEYTGEAFVITEWVKEVRGKPGKYVTVGLSVCDGLTFVTSIQDAPCSNYPVEDAPIPASRVRRWWLND